MLLTDSNILLTDALMDEVAPGSSIVLAQAMRGPSFVSFCLGWFLGRLGIGGRYAR